jgi:ribonuclease BN (tRNA processing enzyme)
MRLRFVSLGVGDAFSALYYSSSLLVIAGEGSSESRLLIDFPSPLRKVLHEASRASGIDLRIESINTTLLTHLHGDHVNGLECFGFYKRFVDGQRPTLYAARPVLAELWDGCLKAGMRQLKTPSGTTHALELDDYFDVHSLETGQPCAIGPLQVEIHPTVHHIPCYAVRVSCGGRRLSYSCDTAFDRTLLDWLADGSDVIVHETNLGMHTPYEALLALPADIRRRMRLIHYHDDFDVERSAIECLREGRVYEV